MPYKQEEIDALLPLPAATFHILMAVADEDRHGYAIIQDIAARTSDELQMSAGTLYRSRKNDGTGAWLHVYGCDRDRPGLNRLNTHPYRVGEFT
jgi:hypothetical protein